MIAIRTLALALAASALLLAADISGKWTGQMPTRGDDTRETTFTLKQDGGKLTGTMSGPQQDTEITDGKVEGDKLSFTVTLNFNGNEIKLLFKGTVSGNEIKMTREREGSGQVREFVVKKA